MTNRFCNPHNTERRRILTNSTKAWFRLAPTLHFVLTTLPKGLPSSTSSSSVQSHGRFLRWITFDGGCVYLNCGCPEAIPAPTQDTPPRPSILPHPRHATPSRQQKIGKRRTIPRDDDETKEPHLCESCESATAGGGGDGKRRDAGAEEDGFDFSLLCPYRCGSNLRPRVSCQGASCSSKVWVEDEVRETN